MTKLVGNMLGHPVSKFKRAPDTTLTIPDCLIGVEFEFEGVGARSVIEAATQLPFWVSKEDHSLRGNGREFVFKEPLFGVDATTALSGLVEYATKNKYVCNIRTGLHVHVDCRDLYPDQLRSMCIAYAAIEPLIYKWVGNNREESNFCVPWYYSEEAVQAATRILVGLTDEHSAAERLRGEAAGYQRYAGFNMNSLDRFGSIEFRQLQTTLNLKRVIDWVNMCLSIKKTGMTVPSVELYKRLNGSKGLDFIEAAIGKENKYQLLQYYTSELEQMGRETAVTIFGGTAQLSTKDKYYKLPDKFKGKNVGLEKFLSKRKKAQQPAPDPRTVPPVEEAMYLDPIERMLRNPNGLNVRMAREFAAPRVPRR